MIRERERRGDGRDRMGEASIEKIILPLDECMAGMILMQPIIEDKTGNIIVPKGQILTSELIKKIGHFNYTQIWIKIESEAESGHWKVSPAALKAYQTYAKSLRICLTKEEKHWHIEIDELKQMAALIVDDFTRDYDLLGCMGLLPLLEKDIYYHSMNVAFLSLLVGRWQGYNHHQLEQLVLTGLLHDVGKLKMSFLCCEKKEEELTLSERLEYRRHPILGYELLATYNELDNEVLKGVLLHHECMDGKGYPLSVKGNLINDFARIVGMVDTFDHLRDKYPVFKAIRHLGSIRLRKFDINILLNFCHNVANYYIGSSVLLSTGEVGEVLFVQPQALYKPIVKVEDRTINLYEETEIDIIKVL